MPSLPEHHHYSIKVKAATTSLDQAVVPVKSALAKLHGLDPIQGRDDYIEQLRPRYQQDQENAPTSSADNKHRSRIEIANLLCTSDSAEQVADAREELQQRQPQQQAPLRAITEGADDQDVHSRSHQRPSYSNSNDTASRGSHYNVGAESVYADEHRISNREPLYSQRQPDGGAVSSSTPSSSFRSTHPDPYPHNSLGTRPASSSITSPTSSSSTPLYPGSGFSVSYTTAPRSTATGLQQRSASWNTDRYQDYSHSYEQEQRRTDRSKSDYALHQQNYGPYLRGSPPMSAAVPHSKSHASSSSSSAPPKRPVGIDSSAPLYYNSPHSAPSVSTSPGLSSSQSYGYPAASNGGHSMQITGKPMSSGTSASSSSRPMHDYAHVQNTEAGSSEHHFRSNGPILPPPAAMFSAAENKPARVYGRDSTADDIWTPAPRTSRVVPIDAPNESRPYPYSNSSMLPPPYPPTSTSSSPQSGPSAPIAPYQSSYSNNKLETKPRRIYGIDAADIPQRMPPPAPSASYRSSQYSKPLQDIPDDIEEESSRRHTAGEAGPGYHRSYGSSASSAYGSPAYGYSSQSGRHYPPQEAERYDYEERGWEVSQQRPPAHESSTPNTYGSRPYSRPQSPTLDIKPPSWYQNYAHSVPPKPQTHPGYQHQQDSYYHSSHPQHHQAGEYSPVNYPLPTNPTLHGSSSKRPSRTAQSVHPFDTTESKSKSKKPKRIKNPGHEEDLIVMDDEFYAVKAKRKRANASQLSVLNAAFERSYFPSTEERLRLSKQCRMCPRTVQIWFQNKRQSVKARSEAMEAAAAGGGESRRDSDEKIREERQGSGSSNEGQKRSIEDENVDEETGGDNGRRTHRHHLMGQDGKRRSSGHGTITPSEAVMSALHIQLDGRSVDYFSRKRRATIAKMEQSEQQKQKQQQQQQQQQQEEMKEQQQ